jgi:hypothetical protein
MQMMIELDCEPLSKARKLTALWHERWGSCERLSDVPLDRSLLFPWVDDLAIFDLVDHGADFRLRAIGGNLIALFDCEFGEPSLSDFPLPYRQTLRQVLLRAAMIRAPATEHYYWLVGGRMSSCIVCAMPIAGGFYQPSQLLLGVFPRLSSRGQSVTTGEDPRSPVAGAPTVPFHRPPPSVPDFLRIETLYLGGGSGCGSAALSPGTPHRAQIE